MNPTSNTSPSLSSKAIALTAAGARQAARLASNIAGVALQWSEMKSIAQDAAHEAVEAAERASLMADCAAVASQEDTIRALAADAWAAVQRALEADTRVTLAIGAM